MLGVGYCTNRSFMSSFHDFQPSPLFQKIETATVEEFKKKFGDKTAAATSKPKVGVNRKVACVHL